MVVVRYNSAGGLLPAVELSRTGDNHLQQAGLLSEFSWVYGLCMQAGGPDLETVLLRGLGNRTLCGSQLPACSGQKPMEKSKGWRIRACCLCHWDVNSVCPQSCKPQTLCTLDFKPFQDLDLICSKCYCSTQGENGSRNCLAVAAKKQPKLQNKQNLQGTGSRINFRNSALPLI